MAYETVKERRDRLNAEARVEAPKNDTSIFPATEDRYPYASADKNNDGYVDAYEEADKNRDGYVNELDAPVPAPFVAPVDRSPKTFVIEKSDAQKGIDSFNKAKADAEKAASPTAADIQAVANKAIAEEKAAADKKIAAAKVASDAQVVYRKATKVLTNGEWDDLMKRLKTVLR